VRGEEKNFRQDAAGHRLDQCIEFLDVLGHEDIGADDDEILGLFVTLALQQFVTGHIHQFDRHAADIACLVSLYRAILIGETDPGLVSTRFGKYADTQFGGQVGFNAEFSFDHAVHFGMRIAAHDAGGIVANDFGFKAGGEVCGVLGFPGRYGFLRERVV
jgi:hypothetical protein